MKNAAIINGTACTSYAYRKFLHGKSALDAVITYAQSLPHIDKVVFLASPDTKTPESYEVIKKDTWNVHELLCSMKEFSKGYDDIFYFFADCPFLDSELAERMYHHHKQYLADYTYADGYPYGISPEIIDPKIISRLINLAGEGKETIKRETLFNLIKKDINAFDIETELASKDLRLLRVNLTADTKRNFMLLERLASEKDTSEQGIVRILDEKPQLLRTLPIYYSIQIVEACPQLCSYCPYPLIAGNITEKKGFMTCNDFQKICDAITAFSEDAVIGISLWGEPALHPDIASLIHAVQERNGLQLVIETSGVGWKEAIIEKIARSGKKNPSWIVSLDGWSKETYKALRGEGYEEAYRTASLLKELFPGKLYVQAVRMKENEDDLEQFFKSWQKQTENVIIQKYDPFCSFLPDRKVTDLSPLHRFPCWHIKRDMSVLIDGTVPLCREDIKKEYVLGNICNDSLETIWQKGEAYYQQHIEKKYPELCKHCDEYYTYTF
jgi:spiro-SPASM protein